MASIKIENADVQSSHPLVIDVMSADLTVDEPIGTHVLKFGDFVLLGSLENLKVVSPADYAQRQADELEEKQAAEKQAQADNKAAQEQGQAQSLSAASTDYAEPVGTGSMAPARLKRKDLENMTKAQLEEVADDYDIDIPSHATKDEMIDAIARGQ